MEGMGNMKILESDKKDFVKIYSTGLITVFFMLILYYLFKWHFSLLVGLVFFELGLIQFYLKERIWFIPSWKLYHVRPIYARLFGGFLIFWGLILIVIGGIATIRR